MKTNSISAGRAIRARTIIATRQLIIRRAWLWTGLLASALIVFAPQPAEAAVTEAWVQRYGSEAGSQDRAYKVVTDAVGNVIVVGTAVLIKYSGAGVPLWTNLYNGPGYFDWPQSKPSLAIGSDDAVYVTTSAGLFLSDFATLKYVWQTEIAIQLLSTIPPKVNLTLSGAPNSSWAIERAPEPTGPWKNLNALVIGPNGSTQFQDTNSPYPSGFYRARQE